MRNVRRGLAVVLALVMLLPSILIPGMAAGKYQDVPDSSWYSAAVEYVTEKGYMAGVSEDSFAPNTPVTRAMFVTVLAKVAGVKGLDDTASVFSDVPAGKWYTGSVAWAAQNGIVSGVSATEFAPNRKITRQDMCVILSKFVQVMEYELPQNGAANFNDAATISSYARGAVAECTAANLIAGFSDGTFRPKGTATRAQIAVIIMRLAELLEGKPVDPVPMPAQEFNGAAGEDMTVAVNAPEGALPENTNMTVSRVTDEAALGAIAEKINGQVYAAADITFTKDGAELEPEKAVEVQISLDGLENLKNPTVYHLRSDDTVEVVSSEFVSVNRSANDKALRFYAKDFSVYIIGEGSDTKLLTVEFRNKDNSIISVQALRISTLNNEAYVTGGKDYIYDPGVPAITATQSFEGWAFNNANFTEEDHGYSVEEINNLIKENRQTYISNNQDVTLTYYAKVYNVRYVVYHDQAGAVLMSQAFHVEDNNGTVSPKDVKIEHAYVGFMGGQNFAGWIEEKYVDVAGDYPLYKSTLNTAEAPSGNVYKNGATYNLNDTLQLYPYLNTGHWLVFDTYKDQDEDATSTSYIGPVFYEEGKNTVAPAVPTRTGYEFKGWYKEKDFTNRFIFGSPINEDTTIYAKWEPKATTYQVVFWQQNPTDAVDAADSAKTYSYYKSDVRVATTGTSVQLNLSESGIAADNRLGGNSTTDIGEMGFYFTYNGTKSDTGSEVVKGDGSTVLNVYYDRKVITYNFYGDLTTGYSSFNGDYYSSYYPHYGIVNNSYVRLNNSSSTYSDGDYRSPNGNWYYGSNTRYTGTVYHLTFDTETLSNNSADVQYGSIRGLYGSTMDSFDWSSASTTISGNDWPYSGNYLMWHDESTGRYQNRMFQYTTGEATTSTTINYYLNQYQVSSTTRPYTCLGQDTDGSFTITLDEGALKSTETLYFAGDEYFGYELDRYNKTANNYNSATQWNGGQVSCSYSEIGSGHAYFYYKRNQWNFVYESNNSQVKTESVYWEKSLSSLSSYVPTNGPEGCYFDGWYADPGFDTPFDFTQEMPNHAVVVYAKWTTIRFRVVLDPTGGQTGVNASDITFPGNQATTFRVDYGELVEGSSINNAEREGYTLLGWYLDKEYTIPYNFSNPVTTSTQNVDMDYINAPDADRQGNDPWNINSETGNPLHYTDVGKDDVRGKLTIYAQWRQDPDGVVGINVEYQATDANGNTGKFTQNNANKWPDPNLYADQAKAFGQPASTPDDPTLQFLYWEILDKDKNVVGKAYPGQLWTVDFKNAVEETLSASDSETETYITATEDDAEPSRSFHPGEIVMPRTETVTVYAPVDTVETGTDYLIGVKASNGTTYLLMSYNPSTGTYYGSASLSGYTTDHLSYAIPAVLDENGNVTGVDASNISGATLAHVEWIFNSTSNGKYSIQSGYNSSYYLRVGDDSTNTTNLNLYPASYSSGYGATWVWDSSTHRLSHYYSSSYARMYLSMLTVGGVPTYFDVDNDTDYAREVQLYKKTTIEVGPTMHTVTFMDGYNNTKIADVEVEDGGAATAPDAPDHSAQGMIFNGWDTAFDNVTEDIIVTAQYVNQSTLSYTVTFRYMDSQGEWVSESQTVKHGENANAPTVPTPPTGYTFNSWDKKYTNITSNLTINAVYKQVATKKYTITLRAKYGLKTTEAKTHINWYANDGGEANNGAGDRFQQNRLNINQSVAIPTPTTWTAGTWEPGQTIQAPTGLSWPGHTFLGWARVDSQTGADAKAHPEFATVDDCWLIWHEDANASGGGYYTVNLEKDPEYEANGGTADKHEANVAADEMRPYHDMYAVWKFNGFFVYHSATGLLEAVDVPTRFVVDNENTGAGHIVTNDTYDITSLVTDGYLYGGYYMSYGGVNTEAIDTLVGNYKAPGRDGWTAPTRWTRGQFASFDVEGYTGEDYDFSCELYTGTSRKNAANNYYWQNACTVNGKTDFVPTPGEVYYLKEVPAEFLTLKYVYVYDELDGNATDGFKIKNFFLFTLVDDNQYNDIGFRMLDNSTSMYDAMAASVTTKSSLSKSYTVSQRSSENHPNPIEIKIEAQTFGVAGGYVATLHKDDLVNKNFAIVPTWVTKDGVTVGNVPQSLEVPQVHKGEGSNVKATPLNGYVGTEKLYVNVEGVLISSNSDTDVWEDANAVTKFYFFGDGNNKAWSTARKVKGHIYCATVPAGNWTTVVIARCKPGTEYKAMDDIWSDAWGQSRDITLKPNSNYIYSFVTDQRPDKTPEWRTYNPNE